MAAEFCMTRNEEEEAADQCDIEHPYDAVSLCDLPLSPPPPPEDDNVSGNGSGNDHTTSAAAAECSQLMSSESDEFEFGWSRDVVLMKEKKKKNASTLMAAWPEMCSPEDVFANGQLLPYRPSVSSETSGLLEVDVLEKSCRSLSRSESLGLNSCDFTNSSRNSSSSRSSFCDSSDRRGRRSSVDSPAGLLYSNPPRIPIPRKRADQLSFHDHSPEFPSGTKMGLFRLNLVRTPEIQLRDLRHRQKKKEDLFAKREGTVFGSRKVSSSSAVVGWAPWRRMFSGMDCKCSVVSDTVTAVTITRRKGDEEDVKMSRVLKLDNNKINETSRRRTFEWVNELSFAHRDYESSINPIH